MAFKILSDDKKAPNGYQFIKCQIIFDIKIKDYQQKARILTSGGMMDPNATITDASMVSRETVWITLTVTIALIWFGNNGGQHS